MNIQDVKNLLIPYDSEYQKKRYGKHNDGGYILYPELIQTTECVYSFGVSDDISFELDILKETVKRFQK